MLAKANRIARGVDYRTTVRRGVRFTEANTVAYVRKNRDSSGVRFGFIVSKAVGNAVRRNLVRRRLKAAAYLVLPDLLAGAAADTGIDIVIRALPASAQASWATLHAEVSRAAARFLTPSTSQRVSRHSVTSEGNVRP
ncbi:hypothetical protein O159_28840 [Leifsonia xyli subsp. cynodontis DSM 46306]|uniref:Ribonuclease P protein component n=1 Tax=Leifsonia xyli subsp. cynodontis DSM 46306 TaxID=1389489 RepID=U3PGD9_LEIXC|nr:ribonuclease P protein component [Leifsonia xyli]AGW42753.1 hypothetical protein O159_28840 [Leifsonia xyli subsp. cynodontis DSM 46306]